MDPRSAIPFGLAAFYLLFGLFLWANQEGMIYYPDSQDFNDCEGFASYEKLDVNGTRLYFLGSAPGKAIVYYHGNAGSACDRSIYKGIFEKTGASVIFVEYAGYSADNREPSGKLILQDVENVRSFLRKNGYENITVYGQSVGSGPASYHASQGGVSSLILVTPFSSLSAVAQSKYLIYPAGLILRDDFDNIGWLSDYKGRLIIIHGDSDSVIPRRFSQDLFQAASTENKEYVLIEGKGHNDIWSSQGFRDALSGYLKVG